MPLEMFWVAKRVAGRTVLRLSMVLSVATSLAHAEEAPRASADKQSLAPLQTFVGQWRGVGLPKRGSNQGAWSETSQWAWHFADGRAELVADFERNKYFSRLRVQAGDETDAFIVLATPADASDETAPVVLRGKLDDGGLMATVESSEAQSGSPQEPARVTIRLVAGGDRMTMLIEKRLSEDAFARLAEVGSTRKGSSFAQAVATGPECVVTGGLGTIAVEFDGKTYFVCCGGCRDLFNEDPESVLADYRERKAAERAEQSK